MFTKVRHNEAQNRIDSLFGYLSRVNNGSFVKRHLTGVWNAMLTQLRDRDQVRAST